MNTQLKMTSFAVKCVFAGTLLAAASASQAACCVFDSRSIVLAINAQTSAVTGTITGTSAQSTAAITAAIKGLGMSLSSSMRENVAKSIGETVIRTTESAERVRQEDRYRLTNPCAVAAAATIGGGQFQASGASVMAGNVGRGGVGGAPPTRGGASSAMKAALDIAAGVAPSLPPELAAQQAAKGACETFAEPGSQRAAQCSAAGLSPAMTSGMPNADIRADTLFDGPQGATPRRRLSISSDPSSQDQTAVSALLRNLNTPLMVRDLRPGEASTDEGRRYLELRNNYESRMSLGERPARRHIARISESTANLPYLKTLMAGEDAAWLKAYLDKNAPNWARSGVSADEVLAIEVYRRYGNESWHKRIVETSPEERQREQTEMLAFSNHLMLQLLQEIREGNIVAGAGAMSTVRAELLPQLMAQHQKAAR